ncbi:MAG TPA: tryptophan halogenase family protein [Sphingomonas sp.]|jgi:tryptophan halogenase
MPDDAIRQIVIVGGGTAGWMAAAALSRLCADGRVGITLVESDEIGTVGVGEATIPTLRTFNAMLGLDEDDFVRATQGTFKLGIEFVGWGRAGDRYLHPFGTAGRDLQAIRFHQFWLAMRQNPATAAAAGVLDDYNLTARAAHLGRFARPDADPGTVLSTLGYAFHFDAGLYARYLRTYAEARGVTRVEGRVIDVRRGDVADRIAGITLDDGRAIDGELFVDCSGFRGLLIEQCLGAGYEDWSRWLPCDRAIAVPCASVEPPRPYTRATADAAGWRWRIPLQHRVGNGYVYASAHIDDGEAERALLAGLDGAPLADPRRLSFTAGRRKRAWVGNCVSIGLAAGFIEPLESTSIHLIQTGIARLLALFPDRGFGHAETDQYNRMTALEYEQVRDFIILHYKATERDDTPFWRRCRDMDVPDTLGTKMELFRSAGRVFRQDDDLFTLDSWVAVMLGQNIMPTRHDPLVDSLAADGRERFLAHLRDVVGRTARAMPTHAAFIAQHCKAA